MRYQAMREHEERFPVRVMCRALAVSPAGYYAWAARPESRRTAANRRLVPLIRVIHAESRSTYGSPRVHATLQAQGQRIGEHRVARLMRASAIQPRRSRSGGPPRIRRISIRSCRTRSIVSLRWRTPTWSGRATSRMLRHARAGSISPWCWISIRAGSLPGGWGSRLTQELATAAPAQVSAHTWPCYFPAPCSANRNGNGLAQLHAADRLDQISTQS